MANGPILAVVQKVGPDAHVTRGGERLPLPPGTVLLPGDEIETASSTLTILFPETGVSRVEPNSRVTLISNPEVVSSTNLFAELDLIQGSVWTRFERLLGPSEWFSVEANGVVATVRGTGFGVSLEKDGSTDVQVADHVVMVSIKPSNILDLQSGFGEEDLVLVPPEIEIPEGKGFSLRLQDTNVKDAVYANPGLLQQFTYNISAKQRERSGYLFSETSIRSEELRLPSILRRLPVEPLRDKQQLERVEILKTLLEYREQATSARGFQPPTRGVLPSEEAPVRLETQTTIQLQAN